MGLQIYVKTLGGNIIALEVESTDLVEVVKQKVHEKEGPAPAAQRLLVAGKELVDGQPLSAYDIQKETTLTLITGKDGAIAAPGAGEDDDEDDEEDIEEEIEEEMTRAEAQERGLIGAGAGAAGGAGAGSASRGIDAEAPKKQKPLPIWDEVDGVSSQKHLVFAAIFFVLFLFAFTQIFNAEYNDDEWQNVDYFHPGGVAMNSRHWSRLNTQFVATGFLPNSTVPAAAQASACIVQATGLADNLWADAANAAAFPKVECSFLVPWAAVWAAMSASFLGFAAVALYSRSVLQNPRGSKDMSDLAETIHKSAMTFLHQEYMWLAPYVFLLWIFLFVAIDGQENDWVPRASVPFLFGAFLSATCGYFGMSIATEGNCRTAAVCYSSKEEGMERGLKLAFRTGACMGLAVVSAGAFGLTLSYTLFQNTQALSGFGFGSSAVALFARVGGGIYTKAADVGADLCGKVDAGLAEDSPKNPATIADCVGDNVGDVAGMGADLFESYVGAVVAACVLGAPEFGTKGVALPLYIMMIGLFVSVACTSFIKVTATTESGTPSLDDLLQAMHKNVMVAGFVITVACLFLCVFLFKDEADYLSELNDLEGYSVPFEQRQPGWRLFGCITLGLVVGIMIGKVTEYFTSHTDMPTQSIGYSSEYGPGPVVIQGLGMGMYSTVVPLVLIVAAVLGSYYLCGFYGTAVSCVGMLSTLGVTMSTDAYGPVSDNAGGIAEMCELPPWVREYTDGLDALGNTTAATGKGFANGSAVLSAISTLTAFARSAEIDEVDLLKPVVVVGLLVGALLPYMFAAMTMLSVNKAAQEMMGEVRRQFLENPNILTDDNTKPDYARCIAISCKSSLREMIMPGVLATFTPLIMGFTFGSHCLVGLLVGSIASGYLLGVMMSNTGGAWDNAKKWVEAGELKLNGKVYGKGTDCHKAAVCGDTVGDPFKDTSGPALNILIKLMTRFAFVLAPLFDDEWKHLHVGLILLFVTQVICVAIYFLVLKDSGKKEEAATSANEPTA